MNSLVFNFDEFGKVCGKFGGKVLNRWKYP